MNTISKTILAGLLLFGSHAFAQETKEKVFKCDASRIPDEYTSDAKFNGLVDKACLEINNGQYENGLRILNEAILVDSLSSGLANEYFKTIRRKLTSFIEENGIKSSAGNANNGTGTAEPTTPKSQEKAPDPAPAPVTETKVADVPASNTPAASTEPTAMATPEVKTTAEVSAPEPRKDVPASVDNSTGSASTPATESAEKAADPYAEKTVTPATGPKTFTPEELQEFQQKGIQKVKSLEGYIKQIADKNTTQSVADDVTDNALALFDSPDRFVEVSSINNPVKNRLKIERYLQKLRLIPYDNINIEWAELQYTSDFIKGADGNYYGYIIFRQRFSSTKDNQVVYEDLTTKKTEVILKSYTKNIEGQAVENWDVFLGDISVEQTEKN